MTDTAVEMVGEVESTDAADAAAQSKARNRRIRNAIGLGGVAGAAVVFSSGCTLSDVSTVLSILKLLGIGG
jgi:hypothetical protein